MTKEEELKQRFNQEYPELKEGLNTFGERLQQLRGRTGLTQRGICRIIDESPSNYNRLENGVFAKPPLDLVIKLAAIYPVSLDELVFDRKVERKPTESGPVFNEQYEAIIAQKDAIIAQKDEMIKMLMAKV